MNNRPSDKELGEVLSFMRDLWALDHGIRSVSKGMRERIGLTGAQRLVLRLIGELSSPAAADLAQHLHVNRSTLAGILSRLERRGFIERRPDPTDGRRVLFAPTARGRAFDTPQEGTVEVAVLRTMGSLPPAKIAAAREVVAALVRELQFRG